MRCCSWLEMARATRQRGKRLAGTTKPASEPLKEEEFEKKLRMEVEAKCAALHAFCEDASLALRSELKIQLLKLPKKVRQMPLKEFLSKFAGDINKVVLDELNARWVVDAMADDGSAEAEERAAEPRTVARRGTRRRAAPGTVMATRTTRKRAREAAAAPATVARSTRSRTRASSAQAMADEMATPAAPRTRQARVPFTPIVTNAIPPGLPQDTVLRNPKRGEVFFSKNGSPLGVCAEAEEGDENESTVAMAGKAGGLITPAPSRATRRGGLRSAVKTCATVRCTRRGAAAAAGEEEGCASPEDLQILVTNEDGEEIQIGGEAIAKGELTGDVRTMALGKLMGLQSKVLSMIQSLGQA